MFSPKNHFRSIAFLEIVSFFFILAVKSHPLAAQAELKKPQVTANAQASVPGYVEQVGNSESKMDRKSRLLPSLLGLAVAGAVVAVLVLQVFKKTGYNPHIIPLEFVRGVDHPYFPLLPGQTRHYQTTQNEKSAEVTIAATGNTRLIMGVICLEFRSGWLPTRGFSKTPGAGMPRTGTAMSGISPGKPKSTIMTS